MKAEDLLDGGLPVHSHELELVTDLCTAISWEDLYGSAQDRILAGMVGFNIPPGPNPSDEIEAFILKASFVAKDAEFLNPESATQIRSLQLELFLRASLRGTPVSDATRMCVNDACEVINRECHAWDVDWLRPVVLAAREKIDLEESEPGHHGQNWRVLGELFLRIKDPFSAGECFERAAIYLRESAQVSYCIEQALKWQQLDAEKFSAMIERILHVRLTWAELALSDHDGDALAPEASVISAIMVEENPKLKDDFATEINALLDEIAVRFYRTITGDEELLVINDPIILVRLTTFTAAECGRLGLDPEPLYVFVALRLKDANVTEKSESGANFNNDPSFLLHFAKQLLQLVRSDEWKPTAAHWLERIDSLLLGIPEEEITIEVPDSPKDINWER